MSELVQQLDEEQEDGINKRRLAKVKQAVKKRRQKIVADKAKKKIQDLQKKATLKAAKGGTAATLLGLVITYAIMTVQFIAGNIFASKNIPKLSFAEVIIWACVTFLIIIGTITALTILIIMAMGAISVACPLCALNMFGAEIIKILGF